MTLLYVSVGVIGNDDPFDSIEFSGATWEEAWEKINQWMLTTRDARYWYQIWA